jgi:hypothetical protein
LVPLSTSVLAPVFASAPLPPIDPVKLKDDVPSPANVVLALSVSALLTV